jgi:hypothetical protein
VLLLVTMGLLLTGGVADASPRRVTGNFTLDVRAGEYEGETQAEVRRAAAVVDARLTPHLQMYADAGWYYGEATANELYAAYQPGATRWRLGRFYIPIGIHAYSELFYTGFVLAPLVKAPAYSGAFAPFRSELGLSADWGSPRLRLEASIAGGDGSQAAAGLDRVEEGSLRIQTAQGRWIVGLNGLAGRAHAPLDSGGFGKRAVRLAGIDWRYSKSSVIVRGEYLWWRVPGYTAYGGYLDVLYHAESAPAWTLVARAETMRLGGEQYRFTIGARYAPAPGWLVQLNLGAGSPSRATRLAVLSVVRTIGF